MVTGSSFPKAHWTHLRTTNVVEAPLATGRRRTTAAKRSKQVEHATAVIGTVLLVAESPFRRPDSAERSGRSQRAR
jgi:transposase-like protein